MAKDDSRSRYIVRHSNLLQPEDYCRFIHFAGFTNDWNDLELDDEDLQILQIQIMLAPQQGPVIAGTGGLRKMRFSPLSWKKGKSGAIRVLYALFPDYSVVVLAAAYAKSEMGNISTGDKKTLKAILGDIGEALAENRNKN